jgi:hypothetical protein
MMASCGNMMGGRRNFDALTMSAREWCFSFTRRDCFVAPLLAMTFQALITVFAAPQNGSPSLPDQITRSLD